MIQVYTDGALAYDSRLPGYELQAITCTCSVKKAGTFELTMPPGHPALNLFTAYKSVTEIFRDDLLIFRGRPLYPTDDFYNCRTITGEGERGFLRDGLMRPYLYQDTPENIFTDVITQYNAQVEEPKQFIVGEITVTDANDYVRLESEKAEQIGDTIDKLVDRCGGYIVFTTNEAGQRVIHWLAELNYRSSQAIEFGQNLLDYARSDSSDDLATRIVPYGAKTETTVLTENPDTGEQTSETVIEYVTIESVNGGLDFIEDAEAVALRGIITKAVYWDDVTEPANLLRKAQEWLAEHKLVVTSLELTAVDLSALDKDAGTFLEGDTVRVTSKPHGLADDFLLYERTYDLLSPENDMVVLGKETQTLTGSDAATDRKNETEMQKVKQEVKLDYQLNVANAVAETERLLMTLIEQTSTSLRTEVSETYATNDELESTVSTSMEQLKNSFEFTFTELQKQVENNDLYARDQFTEFKKYIRFENGDIILGEEGNAITLRLENDRIKFLDEGTEVAYISDKQLYITDAHFLNSLRLGNFAFIPRQNGNLSLVKVGG